MVTVLYEMEFPMCGIVFYLMFVVISRHRLISNTQFLLIIFLSVKIREVTFTSKQSFYFYSENRVRNWVNDQSGWFCHKWLEFSHAIFVNFRKLVHWLSLNWRTVIGESPTRIQCDRYTWMRIKLKWIKHISTISRTILENPLKNVDETKKRIKLNRPSINVHREFVKLWSRNQNLIRK